MTGFEECPNCGAPFKRGRLACPECGSDSETGWKSPDEIDYQSIEVPDYYDETTLTARRASAGWLLVASIALVAFIVWVVLR